MVRVTVGAHEKPFTFHKNLICKHSEYFSRAFGPNFKEGEDGVLHVTKSSERTCRLFQTWVYIQVARSPPGLSEISALMDTSRGVKSLDAAVSASKRKNIDETKRDISDYKHHDNIMGCLFYLYHFADAYECVKLRNDVMSAFNYLKGDGLLIPNLEGIAVAFDQLPISSTYCQYYIKNAALNWKHCMTLVETRLETLELPQDFLVEVVHINHKLAREGVGMDALREEIKDSCSFHEHANEEEKQLCRSRSLRDKPYIDALISACYETVKAYHAT
jgi:hypothetical protein